MKFFSGSCAPRPPHTILVCRLYNLQAKSVHSNYYGRINVDLHIHEENVRKYYTISITFTNFWLKLNTFQKFYVITPPSKKGVFRSQEGGLFLNRKYLQKQTKWSHDTRHSFCLQKRKEMVIFWVSYPFKLLLEPKWFKRMQKVTILRMTAGENHFRLRKSFLEQW